MSNIPKARAMVAEVASALGVADPIAAAKLREAVKLMTRRSPMRRAPRKSPPVGPVTAELLRQRAKADPDKPLAEIAAEVGVNPGRVSEALHHER